MLWSQLNAVALVQAEHLFLVVLLEVVNDEIAAIWDMLLFATER